MAPSKNRVKWLLRLQVWHTTHQETIQYINEYVHKLYPHLQYMKRPGDSNIDYGHHLLLLNFPDEVLDLSVKVSGIGSLRIGLAYNPDSKVKQITRKGEKERLQVE